MSEVALLDERFEKTPPAADPSVMSPAQLLATLRRNWPLILFLGLLFGVAGYAYTITSVPRQYTTAGVL